jgi:TolB-like protein
VNGKRSFLTELKRRNVLRAGVLYIGAVWALAQGIAQLAPVFGAPGWIARWFVIAAAVAFPFWLVFAWIFEFTARGLQREDALPSDPVRVQSAARRLDFAIIAVLAVAVVLLLTNTFVWHKGSGLESQSADAKSVAVLPLTNESGDPKQDYFSDGLSETLISELVQINALKVIGKNSSFQFRNSKSSPAEIGARLGAANLLEGSVRVSGRHLRVMVELVRARDASDIWSQTYDRNLEDVFAVQSDIARAVAAALQVKLGGKPTGSEEKPASGNVAAYRAMLQGRAIARHGTAAAYRQGIAVLEGALREDPRYAYVYGLLSNYWINLGVDLGGAAQQQAFVKGRENAAHEFELAPDTASAHIDRAYVLSVLDLDQTAALAEYRRGYELAPNDGSAISFLALQLGTVGEWQSSAGFYRKAITTDPLRPDWYAILTDDLIMLAQLRDAEHALHTALALQADFPGLHQQLTVIDILRGDAQAAQRDAAQEASADYREWAVAMAAQITGDGQADAALQRYIGRNGATEPFTVANLYAIRRQPDRMLEWLDKAWAAHDTTLAILMFDPFVLRYRNDPRFAAFSRKLGLPATLGAKRMP